MPIIDQIEVGVLSYEPAIQWPGSSEAQAATVVVVRTAGGIEGTSITWNDSPSPSALAMTVQAWFARDVIGKDVRLHPANMESLLKRAAWNGTSCNALAAIDNALWDAKAKVHGLPVHAMLGTRHQALPVYAGSRDELAMTSFEAVADHVVEAREASYGAYKLHLWGGPDSDVAGCEFVRNRVGGDYPLMFDPLERYTLTEAVDVAQALSRLDFKWLEDPIPAIQRSAYDWLAQRVDIPLLASDSLLWNWNDYMDVIGMQTPIMIRLDAGRQGITFTSKLTAIANARGVACEFHAFGPEANSVAGLHTALAQALPSYYEGCFPRAQFEIPGIEVPTRHDEDGKVAAPRQLGLGLDVDWGYIRPRVDWVRQGS